jgi:hypothetical protein
VFKKFLTAGLILILLIAPMIIPASAVPFIDGGIRISGERSYIEAVHFDGGEGNFLDFSGSGAYHLRPEFEAGNSGPQTEFGDSGFEGNIGWTESGEWVQYTVQVEQDGRYKFEAYLASGASGGAGNIELSYNDTVIGSTNSADTWGWQDYDWYTAGEADMAAGTHVIKAEFLDGRTNLAAIRVTRIEEIEEREAPAEIPADYESMDSENTEPETEITEAPEPGVLNDESLIFENLILWIIIAAAAVIFILAIVVLAAKKK